MRITYDDYFKLRILYANFPKIWKCYDAFFFMPPHGQGHKLYGGCQSQACTFLQGGPTDPYQVVAHEGEWRMLMAQLYHLTSAWATKLVFL